MIRTMEGLVDNLVGKLRNEYGAGCLDHYLGLSGGVDSATVVALLCLAFGPKKVWAVFRDLHSNPVHYEHAKLLQEKFGFNLIYISADHLERELLRQINEQISACNSEKFFEIFPPGQNTPANVVSAYGSGRSRFNTWAGAYISKLVCKNGGRIYGTGNGEEDYVLRYFDKFGDGAVDNNILAGLNKAEVRQLALYLGVPREIVVKTPSADLEGCGDNHNDESQLTAWAKQAGYKIKISYGAPDGSKEGNVAWAWRQDLVYGWFKKKQKPTEQDFASHNYNQEEKDLLCFLWELQRKTDHKVLGIPGTDRRYLMSKRFIE